MPRITNCDADYLGLAHAIICTSTAAIFNKTHRAVEPASEMIRRRFYQTFCIALNSIRGLSPRHTANVVSFVVAPRCVTNTLAEYLQRKSHHPMGAVSSSFTLVLYPIADSLPNRANGMGIVSCAPIQRRRCLAEEVSAMLV